MRFLLPVNFYIKNIMDGEFNVTTFIDEVPAVIKKVTKQYTLEKSIAIDELKVALKKCSKELYPSEMVDVLEEFIEGLNMNEDTIKYENFRIIKDEEALLGSKSEVQHSV